MTGFIILGYPVAVLISAAVIGLLVEALASFPILQKLAAVDGCQAGMERALTTFVDSQLKANFAITCAQRTKVDGLRTQFDEFRQDAATVEKNRKACLLALPTQ